MKTKYLVLLFFFLFVFASCTSDSSHYNNSDHPEENIFNYKVVVFNENSNKNDFLGSDLSHSIWDIQVDIKVEEELIIPNDVILRFNGGVFKGSGKIVGNETQIDIKKSEDKTVFFDPNLIVEGKWKTDRLNVSWFGDDTLEDATQMLNNIFTMIGEGGTVDFPQKKGTYYVSRSTPKGDYNAAVVVEKKSITINGNHSTLKLLPQSDCIVLRCGYLRSKTNQSLTINSLNIDGNWDEQTWVGPKGGEYLGIYDQNGIYIFAYKKASLNQVVARNIAQDGISGGNCETVILNQCTIENTGKGGASQFLTSRYILNHCEIKNPNSSPSLSKPIYTTSTEGYACATLAYPNSAIDNELDAYQCKFTVDHDYDKGIAVALLNDAYLAKLEHCNIQMKDGTNAIKIGGTKNQSNLYLKNMNIQSLNTHRSINIVGTNLVRIDRTKVNTSLFLQSNKAYLSNMEDNWLRIHGGDSILIENSRIDEIKIENSVNRLRLVNTKYNSLVNKSLISDLIIE